MPLSRGDYLSADADKRIFAFTMMNGDDVIQCSASWEFVDGLDQKRPRQWTTREEQFATVRALIEERALRKFARRLSAANDAVNLRTNDLMTTAEPVAAS